VGGTRHLKDSIDKFKILRIMNIAMIDIDHAIPVKKHCAILHYDTTRLACLVSNDIGSANINPASPKKSQGEDLHLTFSSPSFSPVSPSGAR
jgi:hypothetical protein